MLEQDNADALFNTAQVLTSLAEIVTDARRPLDEQLSQAAKYLQEAIELFQRCLLIQELKYTEMQEQIKQMESGHVGNDEQMQQVDEKMDEDEEEDDDDASDSKPSDRHEQWAAVVEPVTKATLVDTAVAQLETLTALCNLLTSDPGPGLPWVEEYSFDLLQTRLPAYVEGSDRQYEASLARAKFVCALNEVIYRTGRIDAETYHREIMSVFGPDLDISADADGLCSKADALTSFNTAIADLPPRDPDAFSKALALRWQSLTSALDALAAASKFPDVNNLPRIRLASAAAPR